jgi:hypothetical protein
MFLVKVTDQNCKSHILVIRQHIVGFVCVSLYVKTLESTVLTGTSDSHPPECVIPDEVLIQFGPADDEHLLLETCRGMK